MQQENLTVSLPPGLASRVELYGKELNQSPSWVIQHIVTDYFAHSFARHHVWGDVPETLLEFADPGFDGADFAEWLCAIYVADEEREREKVLLRQHAAGVRLSYEDEKWLYRRGVGAPAPERESTLLEDGTFIFLRSKEKPE